MEPACSGSTTPRVLGHVSTVYMSPTASVVVVFVSLDTVVFVVFETVVFVVLVVSVGGSG